MRPTRPENALISSFVCVRASWSSRRVLTQSSRPPSVRAQRFHLTWSCAYTPNVFIVVYWSWRPSDVGPEKIAVVTGV